MAAQHQRLSQRINLAANIPEYQNWNNCDPMGLVSGCLGWYCNMKTRFSTGYVYQYNLDKKLSVFTDFSKVDKMNLERILSWSENFL